MLFKYLEVPSFPGPSLPRQGSLTSSRGHGPTQSVSVRTSKLLLAIPYSGRRSVASPFPTGTLGRVKPNRAEWFNVMGLSTQGVVQCDGAKHTGSGSM